jgi:hypothetical protein
MSFIDRARRTVSNTVQNLRRDPVGTVGRAVEQGVKGYTTFTKARTAIKDGFDNARSVRTDGFRATWRANAEKVVSKATNPNSKLDMGGRLAQAGKVFSTVTGAAKLPGQVGTAISDVRNAVRSGSREDFDKAVGSVATAGKTALTTARGGLELARDVQKFGSAYRAASSAFRAEVPNATGRLARSVAGTAARQAFEGADRTAARQAVRSTVDGAVDAAGRAGTSVRSLTGTASRSAARAALNEGGKAAARGATTAAARAAAGPLAKAAGRFAPGANIAIAGLDVANAYSTVRDPNASTTKKVTSVITAVGSVAAATNIPVVSQIGAGVSAVSSFVGGLFG